MNSNEKSADITQQINSKTGQVPFVGGTALQAYRVTLYAVVRVAVDVPSASSQLDAIAIAQSSTNLHDEFRGGEYAEEVVGVLVDEAGDHEYLRSTTYSPSTDAESGWAVDLGAKPDTQSPVAGNTAIDLSVIESEALVTELRCRGLVVSTWGTDDATTVLENDDSTSCLTDEQFDLLEAKLFEKASATLEDLLADRGNQHISDTWDIYSPTLMAEVR
jgi:hypothetical protein